MLRIPNRKFSAIFKMWRPLQQKSHSFCVDLFKKNIFTLVTHMKYEITYLYMLYARRE